LALVLSLLLLNAWSQNIWNGDIYLMLQEDVDSFEVNYPGITIIDGTLMLDGGINNLDGLSNLTKISGHLELGVGFIGELPFLQSLQGLASLDTIGGQLIILNCDSLLNLDGLQQLSHVDDIFIMDCDRLLSLYGLSGLAGSMNTLAIQDNAMLNDLSGIGNVDITASLSIQRNERLESLTGLPLKSSLSNQVWIERNTRLKNLQGLDSLKSIHSLYVSSNDSLESLQGLEGLEEIRTNLNIRSNPLLQALGGLDSLRFVKDLKIAYNESLSSLNGMYSLESDSLNGVRIEHNPLLSDAGIPAICDYLSDLQSYIYIYHNNVGCNSPGEVAASCGISLNCLPWGVYEFPNQAAIDSFPYHYQNCTELFGNIYIEADDITNLDGLIGLEAIKGNLSIRPSYPDGTMEIQNLNGLANLKYVEGNLGIGNNLVLEDLSGLNNLKEVGRSLSIGNNKELIDLQGLDSLEEVGLTLIIASNPKLENLAGIESLISTKYILVRHNLELENLTGLQNIDHVEVQDVDIYENPKLVSCDVEFMCEVLGLTPEIVSVYDNQTGCNSVEQVQDSCIAGVELIDKSGTLYLYPNPASRQVFISGLDPDVAYRLGIYNYLGQLMLQQQDIDPVVNIEKLDPGVYIIELQSENYEFKEQLIVL